MYLLLRISGSRVYPKYLFFIVQRFAFQIDIGLVVVQTPVSCEEGRDRFRYMKAQFMTLIKTQYPGEGDNYRRHNFGNIGVWG